MQTDMKISDIIVFACRNSLRGLRTKLISVSAVAVSIAAVTLLSALSAAGKAYVRDRLDSVGISGLAIISKKSSFEVEDIELLANRFDEIKNVMPLTVALAGIRFNSVSSDVLMWGIGEGAEDLISAELLFGRFPTKEEIDSAATVIVIESSHAIESYKRENVIGKKVTVSLNGVRTDMTVIGVAQPQSGGLLQTISADIPGFTYTPYTTLAYLSGEREIGQLAVEYTGGADKEELSRKITALLCRMSNESESNYEIEDIGSYKERAEGILDTVSFLITAVAAVSLAVAGLCIMSTMLSAGREKKKRDRNYDGDRRRQTRYHSFILSRFCHHHIYRRGRRDCGRFCCGRSNHKFYGHHSRNRIKPYSICGPCKHTLRSAVWNITGGSGLAHGPCESAQG